METFEVDTVAAEHGLVCVRVHGSSGHKGDGGGLKGLEWRLSVRLPGRGPCLGKGRANVFLTQPVSPGWHARRGPAPALHLLPLHW